MRTALILIQAAILTVIAVIGAQGDSGQAAHCPLPASQASGFCQD